MASTYLSLPSASVTGPLDVVINAANDSIRISDGTDTLAINPDGSINISSLGSLGAVTLTGENEFTFGEQAGVAVGATVTVVSQTFPAERKLRRVSCTGDNIGVFTLKFGTSTVDKSRSTYSNYNVEFDYETGITIPAGTTVAVEGTNSGSGPGEFSARLLYSPD